MPPNDNPIERRRHPRSEPVLPIRVSTVVPPLPLTDVEVIDVSAGGIALLTRVPVVAGQRLSFSVAAAERGCGASRLRVGQPAPILAEVLSVEPVEGGQFRCRCRALLGAFEAA